MDNVEGRNFIVLRVRGPRVCIGSIVVFRRTELTLKGELRVREQTVRVTLVELYLDFSRRKRLCSR